jgi:hypothetical protein
MQGTTGGESKHEFIETSFIQEQLRAMAVELQLETSVHIERHYAVAEIAEMWNLSPDKVREIFEDEPGVLVIGDRNPRHKRRYVTLRIPQSVLQRVHRRLSLQSVHLGNNR